MFEKPPPGYAVSFFAHKEEISTYGLGYVVANQIVLLQVRIREHLTGYEDECLPLDCHELAGSGARFTGLVVQPCR